MQELNWDNDNEQNLNFPVHYWNYIEETFSQFGTGEHIVTKAYEADNDYLGFTDDYDFCFGPVNEGEGLKTQEYPEGWESDPVTGIEYTTQDYGYNEYSGRLWGVYQASIGEIYLLKANEDLTAWERNELLTFSPTGSQKPTIEFNPEGYYEIAVEITIAGTSTKEIWLMSYPYEGDSIRKVCEGSSPTLVLNYNKDLILFYTDQEQTNVYYRLESENYNTEHSINYISEPERQLDFINAFKIDSKEIIDKPYPEFSPDPIEYSGKLIVFYKRDDDYKPYKYTLTNELYRYNFKYKEPVLESEFSDTINSIDINLSNLTWEDMRYLITLFSSPEADVYIEGQRQQESVATTLDTTGEGTVLILPYDTVYKVVLDDNDTIEDSWGILVFNNDETKKMDIQLPFLGDDSKPKEINDIDISIGNINWQFDYLEDQIIKENNDINISTAVEWEIMYITTTITLKDLAGNPIDGANIIIEAQRDMPEINLTTDASGQATEDLLVYDTAYNFISSKTGYETEDNLALLVENIESKTRSVDMYISDGAFDRIENSSLDIAVNSVLWLEV